jgi:hypothetical protein
VDIKIKKSEYESEQSELANIFLVFCCFFKMENKVDCGWWSAGKLSLGYCLYIFEIFFVKT